ncbi:Glycosyltransferase, catalytic subunit of cellulose synthase and poly-beta-1,6-N-acetylglucosamine synthase [Mucilaginibacter lappiensis]|uniref:Glycosyltransferase involved in cell wall biosynthesis n=1 Tax=Mucilaginibacter lappiensis TaxID=354630 RepID=A0ABR6PC29_9SPHI|nr:glycosyltransferase [Mucilaginibacter lappiensis]MBB6107304.1 glycosyltransferase involved in cell wall biosynthesis [Mucilaginibacter lappiensis]SIQ12953.1 Glycosyltransferase, catalytic subunit of cellulose synthase and poly-beta-1,6-N-acetylglucosamine synthase [Mucilaginibacter lappiensis]
MFFSIIIPLYNRPQEIKELLETLVLQTYKTFEVLVIEDGSVNDAEAIVNSFSDKLEVRYFKKPNEGQGFTRNFGFERAKGDYFIVFDSDCLIPPNYLEIVNNSLATNYLDAYGGPDGAHSSFTPTQKAISYSMTSPFTTGGIRGNKKSIGQFHPRSFNMGISRQVWEKAGGFIITRLGEDIEYSIRIHSLGFKIGLIPNAVVYHKRRTNFLQFYKQLHFFGRARINIYKFFPKELKAVHFFPAVFTMGVILTLIFNLLGWQIALLANILLAVYILLIFFHAWWKNKSVKIAFLSIIATFTQLIAYGLGFMQDFWKRVIFNRS